jgi:hypothetical protein
MNLRLIGMSLALCLISAAQLKAQIIYPADNGFESPDLGSGGGALAYAPAGASWTFSGGAGIAANNSAFDVFNATQGQASDSARSTSGQAGFLQGISSIGQSVYLPAGVYSLTFNAVGRGGGTFNFAANEISVTLGNDLLFVGTPDQGAMQTETTSEMGVLISGYYTLTFSGDTANTGSNQGDHTTFIDNIQINTVSVVTVPEPGCVSFLAMGFFALIAFRRLRRQAMI